VFFRFCSTAQDLVVKTDGETITALISEINQTEIVFTYPGESLINRVSLDQIERIEFKSGRVQKFNNGSHGLSIKEPKYIGEIFAVTDDSEFVKLEQQKMSGKINYNASALLIGIGKAKSKNVISGSSSPVRLKEGNPFKFIIKTGNQQINPNEYFNVFSLESSKEKRYVKVGQSNSFGTSKSMDLDYQTFKATPYGKHSFLIEISSLEKKEYAITIKGSRDIFNMFGVY